MQSFVQLFAYKRFRRHADQGSLKCNLICFLFRYICFLKTSTANLSGIFSGCNIKQTETEYIAQALFCISF